MNRINKFWYREHLLSKIQSSRTLFHKHDYHYYGSGCFAKLWLISTLVLYKKERRITTIIKLVAIFLVKNEMKFAKILRVWRTLTTSISVLDLLFGITTHCTYIECPRKKHWMYRFQGCCSPHIGILRCLSYSHSLLSSASYLLKNWSWNCGSYLKEIRLWSTILSVLDFPSRYKLKLGCHLLLLSHLKDLQWS